MQKEYEVLLDHQGDYPYKKGSKRQLDDSIGDILVNAGILKPVVQRKTMKKAPNTKAES